MKKIFYPFLGIIISIGLFISCDGDKEFTKNLNYVTFEASSFNLGVDIDGSTAHVIKVYTANKTSSDRTFNVNVIAASTTAEAGAYTMSGTVTVPANSNEGEIMITLNDVNIGSGKVLKLELGKEDELFTGSSATINIKQICRKNEVALNITFDSYASECSWELLNSSNVVIASGGDYNDGDKKLSTTFCLDNGTYTFKVYDAYGDGLSGGSVQLSSGSTVLFSAVGNYGSGKSGQFSVGL